MYITSDSDTTSDSNTSSDSDTSSISSGLEVIHVIETTVAKKRSTERKQHVFIQHFREYPFYGIDGFFVFLPRDDIPRSRSSVYGDRWYMFLFVPRRAKAQ
ncbi:12730_t:CDS:2 [Ambispora gerdemannii]|uniref:12730_t:CDS:1 n=1 Tax=Ambispora gerdemannii TaxID=144530 RepID=A0A9N9C891_9GLOM|nr:12730_t:CDS:2 [Ambispora gerdemannii]